MHLTAYILYILLGVCAFKSKIMTKEINQKLEELKEIFTRETSGNVSSIHIFINYQGAKIEIMQRDPVQLKKDSVSMKNIAGEWIR
jgi:hypothetical protein